MMLTPRGEFKAVIRAHELGRNRNTGSKEIAFVTDVTAAVVAGHEEPLVPSLRKRAWYPLTAFTMEWVLPVLESLGFDGDWSRLDPAAKDAHDFSGQVVSLVCQHREFQDPLLGHARVVERWRILPDAPVESRADPAVIAELAAEFGPLLKKGAGQGEGEEPKNEKRRKPRKRRQDVPEQTPEANEGPVETGGQEAPATEGSMDGTTEGVRVG